MKSLWRGLFFDTIWNRILVDKYLRNLSIFEWFRSLPHRKHNISTIWRGFVDVAQEIGSHIAWQIGSGALVKVGIDPVVGGGQNEFLPDGLFFFFHERGYSSLDHFGIKASVRSRYWLSPEYFQMAASYRQDWRNYVTLLNRLGVTLGQEVDRIAWTFNQSDGRVTASLAYDFLWYKVAGQPIRWWAGCIWKWKVPLKLVCFFLLVLHNKILTWDNLCLRGWQGPGLCPLCRMNLETVLHIFFDCTFARQVWDFICVTFQITWEWRFDSMEGHFMHWRNSGYYHQSLFI